MVIKKLSSYLNTKSLIIVFIIINIILLLYFLGVPNFFQTKLNTQTAWQLKDYPEINKIKGSNWDFKKLEEFFQDLADKKGGEYAYHALTVASNKGFITANVDTHLLGHVVGDVIYEQKGIEGMKICTDDIRNACSHSIVVGYLLDNGEDSLPKAVSVCHEAPGGSGAYTMCVHGLGHGVLAYEGYDMRKAVELCKKTGTPEYGNQEVGQCVGGVTMEMMAGVHDRDVWEKQVPNYLKNDDPLAPCNMGFIPKNALGFCYTYLTPHLFQVAGANIASPEPKYFNKAMSYCLDIPKGDFSRTTCLASFGKEFVVLANARNVQSVTNMSDDQLKLIYNWCSFEPAEGLNPCLDSALQSLYWGGENDPDVSIRFCSIIPNKDTSGICMKSLIGSVSNYMRDNESYKQSFCIKIPQEYRDDCNSRLLVKK